MRKALIQHQMRMTNEKLDIRKEERKRNINELIMKKS
jgi:hypothetical protein